MLKKSVASNSNLLSLLKDIKNKKFWFIQLLNLIKFLKNLIKYCIFSYLIVSATVATLTSSALHLSHSQQMALISWVQGCITFILVLDFFWFVIKNIGSDFFSTNLIPFLKRLVLYFLTIFSIIFGVAIVEVGPEFSNLVDNIYVAQILIGCFLIFFSVELIIYKILVFKVTKEKSRNTWKEWLALERVDKRFDYSSSHSITEYISEVEHDSFITQIVTVRIKYSNIKVSRERRTYASGTKFVLKSKNKKSW